jgi:MFS family permease
MPDQEQRHEMHGDATRVSQAYPSEVGTEWSTWRPLRLAIFRNLLVADLVSDMGTFMQGVGAAWLMVSQGAGPLLVALTQTASAFPFFLLALPAGALGDIFDRRKLILTTEVWMFSVAVVLAVLTMLHLITPWALLLLTLALSIGDALEAPTWRAVLPEVVPKEGLMPAIALNGIEFNLARAIGPAGWISDCGVRNRHSVFTECRIVSWRALGDCAMEATGTPAGLATRDRVGCDPRGSAVHEKRA